jgi:hypothetical protein
MTPDQLSAIRERLDAANTHAMSTQIEIDRDGTTHWINLGPFLCVSHDDAYQVRCLVTLMHYAPTDLRALLDEVARLTTLLAGTEAVLENEREYQARLKAEVGQLANESFRRGAEAMRTALLQRVSWGSDLADRIRDEPVPEDR